MFGLSVFILILLVNLLVLKGSRVELDNQCLNCFNIDYDKTIWLEQEQHEELGSGKSEISDDLFGFSLALGEKEVYIGAPGFGDTGNIYHCPVSFGKSTTSPNAGSFRRASCSDTELNTEFRKRGRFRTKCN